MTDWWSDSFDDDDEPLFCSRSPPIRQNQIRNDQNIHRRNTGCYSCDSCSDYSDDDVDSLNWCNSSPSRWNRMRNGREINRKNTCYSYDSCSDSSDDDDNPPIQRKPPTIRPNNIRTNWNSEQKSSYCSDCSDDDDDQPFRCNSRFVVGLKKKISNDVKMFKPTTLKSAHDRVLAEEKFQNLLKNFATRKAPKNEEVQHNLANNDSSSREETSQKICGMQADEQARFKNETHSDASDSVDADKSTSRSDRDASDEVQAMISCSIANPDMKTLDVGAQIEVLPGYSFGILLGEYDPPEAQNWKSMEDEAGGSAIIVCNNSFSIKDEVSQVFEIGAVVVVTTIVYSKTEALEEIVTLDKIKGGRNTRNLPDVAKDGPAIRPPPEPPPSK